ncbi:DUF1707 SHOCT-like domain-containing protein [Nonomuraea aridisoli]|uniref:DUF1707 SHOCT-like domain-containing protein n=1 Tax=Nonomuraea aridisoli TaxID=2070368 RepID=UPI0011B93B5D|nr:DUF1707 domain-containing protein [Nonomuraea aridisoli]
MDRDDLRVGDAEREQTMAALREHFAQGRLTHEELDERLDQALAAKTGRDLARVTADLPGHGHAPAASPWAPERGPGWGPGHHHGPGPFHDVAGWRAAAHAHREQMRAMRHAQREAHRAAWADRRGHLGRGHHGPRPFLPVLFVIMALALIFGGGGLFKVLFVVFVAALLFSLVHRRFHSRR